MIKLKSLLTEAEMKYSKNGHQKMLAMYYHINSSSTPSFQYDVEIEYKDVIFTNSKQALNGMVLHHLLEIDFFNRAGSNTISSILNAWDGKNFENSLINTILRKPFVVFYSIIQSNPRQLKRGSAGILSDGSLFLDITNPCKYPETLLIHELQHITQQLNEICLIYGKKISKLTNIKDIKYIQKIDQSNTPYIPDKIGVGKYPPDIHQRDIQIRRHAIETDPTLTPAQKKQLIDPLFDLYLASDNEYESWKTQTVYNLMEIIIKDPVVFEKLKNYYIVTNGNLDKKFRKQKYKELKNDIISPASIFKQSIQSILKDDNSQINTDMKTYFKDYVKFIHTMKQYRPREIFGELLNDLEALTDDVIPDTLKSLPWWKPYKKVSHSNISEIK